MPDVQARYRTTDETAIVGESLAGLFVIETFLLEPDLFDTYIAIDPSLWWNDGALVKSAPERLHEQSKVDQVAVVREQRRRARRRTVRSAAALTANAPNGLQWHYEPMPQEKHSTIYHPAALGRRSARCSNHEHTSQQLPQCPEAARRGRDDATDACVYFYDCKGCGTVLRPKSGDCCVFCSYGSVKCPPIQMNSGCCGTRGS